MTEGRHVTVGVPTFNRSRELSRALGMIAAQTYDDVDVVVWDDGSSDDTFEVASAFGRNVCAFRSPRNEGMPHPLNHILDIARGDYIVMLHDHDRFDPHLLEGLVDALEAHPQAGFANPSVSWETADGHVTPMMPFEPGCHQGATLIREMLLGEDFACPITACAMVRKSAYAAAGRHYADRFGFISDVDLWLRLAWQGTFVQAADAGIICKTRGKDHTFAGADWRIPAWSIRMQQEHLDRFRDLHPQERDAADRAFRRRRRKAAALGAAVHARAGHPLAGLRGGAALWRIS